MNKIEKLIAELCPEGVEFNELGDLTSIETGTQLNKTAMAEIGDYPVINGGINPSGFYHEYNTDENTIAISQGGASAGYVNFITTKFWAGAHCFVIKLTTNEVENKYLYFILKNGQEKLQNAKLGAGIPGLNKKELQGFKIPIPPLAIQEEIVKILDTFTTLEAELEVELEARKKQYEYYRERLLMPIMVNGKWLMNNEEVEWKTLGEIGKVSMCKRIFKDETLTSGDIPFYKIGTFGKQPDAFISREVFDEYRRKFSFPKKGDVLLSASGTIGRRVIYNGEPAYFQDSNIIWIDNDESKVLNKFLYYLYEIIEWKTEGGTIQRLYNDNLKKIKIPIPPLAEQERIVAILDKFDALVNDISVGLPAELNAQRKQYEYYRNKLLTFKRLAVND